MNELFEDFAKAYAQQNGYLLAQTLSPIPPPDGPHKLRSIWQSTNPHSVKGDVKHFIKTSLSHRQSMDHKELNGWVEVYTAYWAAVSEICSGEDGSSSWTKTYDAWKNMTNQVIRGYQNSGFEAWTLPCLYLVGKYLNLFAIKSDEERVRNHVEPSGEAALLQDDFDPEAEKQGQLRDCEQVLKRIFTLCLNDRSPLEESRKWGIYFVINLLFRTYFKLNSASMSRTILKTLQAYSADLPALEVFPKSQRVTFKYYEGVLYFLEENYIQAEKYLQEAWDLCHKDAKSHLEHILTYLIPCRLLTENVLPTKKLLADFPKLQELFLPLATCIRKGDLREFDVLMEKNEDAFIKRRIFLTLERGRDVAMRNLLRKVFVVGGFEEPKEGDLVTAKVRRTRVPVAEFQAAIIMCSGGDPLDTDEVECVLANMIYKDLMKGYVARERGIVVLSKKGAFPGTGV